MRIEHGHPRILPCSEQVSEDHASERKQFVKEPLSNRPEDVQQNGQQDQPVKDGKPEHSAFSPQAGSGCPVNCVYASTYFSLVLAATSSGNPGAGGCLFHLIDSR